MEGLQSPRLPYDQIPDMYKSFYKGRVPNFCPNVQKVDGMTEEELLEIDSIIGIRRIKQNGMK